VLLRYLWFVAGWVFVGIGAIGVVLPGIPTTFPMILALGCFARSSRRFHDWLYHHRVFGPPLQRWSAHRVIPVRAKVAAVSGMGISLVVLATTGALAPPWMIAVVAFMAIGAGYVLSRPSVPPATEKPVVEVSPEDREQPER
jgi:uncharacterized protein